MSTKENRPSAAGQVQSVTTTEAKRVSLDDILVGTKIPEESHGLVKEGVREMVEKLLDSPEGLHADAKAVDRLIADIDKRLGEQMDLILHAEEFQKLESAWRSLKFLVNKTNFREKNEVWVLNASQEEMAEDLAGATEISQSGLYELVYKKQFDQFGAEPYSVMIGNYNYGPGNSDVTMLENMGRVAAMSHAPFIAAAKPEMFGKESYEELPEIPSVEEIFKGNKYIKFRSFRESDDARSVGLTLPRMLLRTPYDRESVQPVKKFDYTEQTSGHEDFLWGNASFAFASRLTDSFSRHRWFTRIIGPKGGGQVEDLPVHLFDSPDGNERQKIPTETMISGTLEFNLAKAGFIPLVFRAGSDNAAFFSANSLKKPETYAKTKEGQEAETNAQFNAQLPYMLIISRLAHYLKYMQTEEIGTTKSAVQLQSELNTWIGQYVSHDKTAQDSIKAIRPLYQADIQVTEIEGRPGWYKVNIEVVPHTFYQGAFFTLSLVGTLGRDKKK